MNAERVYAALLSLYPRAFREEYADAMLEAFRQLSARARTDSPAAVARFWIFVASDACRSAFHEHVAACRADDRLFILQWVGVCTLGAMVTALLAHVLSWGFAYLYHPYFEGITITPRAYGAFLGCGLGLVQSVALRQPLRIAAPWVLVSVLSTALGLEFAVGLAASAGPLVCGLVLGVVVGGGQWLVLRTHAHRAEVWIGASALALSAGVFAFGEAMQRTFAGLDAVPNVPNPLNVPNVPNLASPDLFLELAIVATSGIVIGALTAKRLWSVHRVR